MSWQDSHVLFRTSLSQLLKKDNTFEVMGEVSDGKEVLELLKSKEVDILVMNCSLPVIDSLAVLSIMQIRFPRVKSVILSTSKDTTMVRNFLGKGAASVIFSETETGAFCRGLKTVYQEGYYMCEKMSRDLLHNFLHKKPGPDEVVFNQREMDVLTGICNGKTNKEIASDMCVSMSAVDFYRTRIYNKVDCSNAVMLMRYAIKNGLVTIN